MEQLVLNATRRTVTGKQVGALRAAGYLPGVVYGPAKAPTAIQMNAREANRVFRSIVGTQLIDLQLDGESIKVLVHDYQRNSIKGVFLHVDFYAPDTTKPFRVAIPVRLTGVSFAVNSLSGVLVHGVTDIAIECLPENLIPFVEVSIEPLRGIGQALFVRDIKLPQGVRVLSDPDEMVARVTYQSKDEDLSASPTAAGEVEVAEKGKKDKEGGEAAPAKKK